MPTYDFFCNDCQKNFDTFLSYSEYGVKPVSCSHCKSANVRRRMTKVRIAKTQEQRYEGMAEEFERFQGSDENPQALGQMMKNMGKELGEPLPAEFNEVVGRLEAGENPQDIEASLPVESPETD